MLQSDAVSLADAAQTLRRRALHQSVKQTEPVGTRALCQSDSVGIRSEMTGTDMTLSGAMSCCYSEIHQEIRYYCKVIAHKPPENCKGNEIRRYSNGNIDQLNSSFKCCNDGLLMILLCCLLPVWLLHYVLSHVIHSELPCC